MASFTDLAITQPAVLPYMLVFTSGGLTAAWNVTVALGPAARLQILQEPASIAPGELFDFAVAVLDAGGNPLRDASILVKVRLAGDYGLQVTSPSLPPSFLSRNGCECVGADASASSAQAPPARLAERP